MSDENSSENTEDSSNSRRRLTIGTVITLITLFGVISVAKDGIDLVTQYILPGVVYEEDASPSFPTPSPAAPTPTSETVDYHGQLLLASSTDNTLYVYDIEKGEKRPLAISAGRDRAGHWSPNGEQILFNSSREGGDQLFVINADGSNPERLTFGPDFACCAGWSPDGDHIVFNANGPEGPQDIFRMKADGSEPPENLTNTSYEDWTPEFLPAGSHIAYSSQPYGNADIMVMDFNGDNKTRLTTNQFADRNPTWSPDGQKIAFYSDRDGNFEIYTMNSNGTVLRNLTNNLAGDRWPVWSPDGAHIAFTSSRNGVDGVYIIDADGQNETLLLEFDGNVTVTDWK